jgi:hypothetical protein
VEKMILPIMSPVQRDSSHHLPSTVSLALTYERTNNATEGASARGERENREAILSFRAPNDDVEWKFCSFSFCVSRIRFALLLFIDERA